MMWQDVAAIAVAVVWIVGMVPALYVAGRYDLAADGSDPLLAFFAVFVWPVGLVLWGGSVVVERVYNAGREAGRP